MAIYIEGNKKIKNIFANVNGEKKSIVSAWVNKDGIPTKVFQLDRGIVNPVDPYEVAPTDEYNDWNYTLDDENGIITLKYYKGLKTDVIVYANYVIDGKTYKTQIASNVSNANYSTSSYMFNGYKQTKCTEIESIIFSNSIDTSTTTEMSNMFYRCSSLTSLDLSNFNTSNVTNMANMFAQCSNLINLNLSNFDTSKVTKMNGMFERCSSLTSLDLSNFNTSNVTNMNMMFYNCSNLNTIYATKGKWITEQVTSSTNMFYQCGTSSVTYK